MAKQIEMNYKESGGYYSVLYPKSGSDNIALSAQLLNDYGLEDGDKLDAALSKIKQMIDTNSQTSAKCQIGSYVGNGTYGSSNPIKLSLNFSPVFIFVCGEQTADSYDDQSYLIWCHGVKTQITHYYSRESNTTHLVNVNTSGNTISWYTPNDYLGAESQLNINGTKYHYIAIGN